MEKDIEILKEFKEKGFATLMIKYNKDRIQTNTMVETAIENVLTELEQLQEDVKELEGISFEFLQENIKLREELKGCREDYLLLQNASEKYENELLEKITMLENTKNTCPVMATSGFQCLDKQKEDV